MLVPNLYGVSPYVVPPSLRNCYIVLLVEPKKWRLLLLSEESSVRMHFMVSGVSRPVFTCWELLPSHTVSMCELTAAH